MVLITSWVIIVLFFYTLYKNTKEMERKTKEIERKSKERAKKGDLNNE